MDQSSSSEFTISKKESKTKRTSNKDDFEREGRWTSQQNLKYLVFLAFNLTKFQCKKKRMFRLYKPLSKFIETRNSEQCRSHHRKLLQRFKSAKNIMNNLEQQFEREQIQQLREKNLQVLNDLPIPQKKARNSEKQEILNEKIEQKIAISNQNGVKKRNQLNLKRSPNPAQQNNYKQISKSPSNLTPIEELTILNYQAFNWLNQIYGPNFNYFFNQNTLSFYNPQVCLPYNIHNY